MTEQQALQPPIRTRMIGNYILGKTLGTGTFGKVKMGIHEQSGERVAIKILEKDRIVETADVERVQREIHILKLVRHPHIIQLYEIIETPKHIFLVMEMVSGGELFEYIVKNTKLQEIEGCKLFQELISGIEYLHKIRVVHRDLKPENLLLDQNKNLKLVDFGLSNTYKSEEVLKTACGSPCYAAPEMIAGQKYTGLKVDLWSSGVILFACLCGYLPFEDSNTSALYKKILSGSYSFPKDLSKEAQDLIGGILTVDPEKRMGINEIRKHNWFKQYKRNYDIPPGIVVGYNRIPIDYEILKSLKQYQIDIDFAQKCLDANKHNHVTTFYHLLLKRHLCNGGRSTADLNSESFDINLLEPKQRPQKTPINSIVKDEVMRQQMKEEISKQRSYSTDKDRGRIIKVSQNNNNNNNNNNNHNNNNNNNRNQILADNDCSVSRVGNTGIAHSVNARPNTGDDNVLLFSPPVQKIKKCRPIVQQHPQQLYPNSFNVKMRNNLTSIDQQRKGRQNDNHNNSVGYRSGNREKYSKNVNGSFDTRLNSGGFSAKHRTNQRSALNYDII